MRVHRLMLLVLVLALGELAQAQDIDIPYQKFVLENGLTLIVHEDHKAPIVAVNLWYHVGSKNEKAGQDGLRAPVRAPDVRRQPARPGSLHQGARKGRRHRPEWHHE